MRHYFFLISLLLLFSSTLCLLFCPTHAAATTLGSNIPNAANVSDLPLKEFYATNKGETMAILITGDGGWKTIATSLGNLFKQNQIPLVGLNAQKYFWTKRTPAMVATDLQRIAAFYMKKWNKQKIIFIGYSMGADVMPFALNLLPKSITDRTQQVMLIAPATTAQFEVKLASYLVTPTAGLSLAPEVQKIKAPLFIVCDNDEYSLCPEIKNLSFESVSLPGGHEFENYRDELFRLLKNKI